MDLPTLVRDLAFVAPSTWVALGAAIAAGVTATVAAGWARGPREASLPRSGRLRGLGIGLVFGALFGACFVFLTGADRGSPVPGLVLVPAAVGSLTGAAVPGAIASIRSGIASPRRVARSAAVTLRDYVPSSLLWCARIAVLVASVSLAFQFALEGEVNRGSSMPLYPQVSMFVVVPALALLIASEIGSRVLVAAPLSAASEAALLGQDRERSRAIREGTAASLTLGLLACLVAVPTIVAAADPQSPTLVLADPLVSELLEISAAAGAALFLACSFRAAPIGATQRFER